MMAVTMRSRALLLALLMGLGGLAALVPDASAQQPDITQEHVYHTWATLTYDLSAWADDIPERVRMSSAGRTVEGREQWVLHISDHSVETPKNTVYIDGGHHGNEYLGTQLAFLVARYYAHDHLDDTEEARAAAQEVLRTTDLWILVMLNADGNDRDTRWNDNQVDLNRNYDFHFDRNEEPQAGDAPFSEPETTNNAQIMAEHASDADLYVTMHTGVWKMLYPWGWTPDLPPDDDLYSLIGRHINTNISGAEDLLVANANLGIYPTHGTSRDYGYGVMGFPTFTFETDEEQFVPGTLEPLAQRLGIELEIMQYLIENIHMWRARLVVDTLEVSADGRVRLEVANAGAGSTDNATVRYRCAGEEARWTSGNFSLSQGNRTTVSRSSLPVGLDDVDCWELHYQKRRVENATWVTEPIPPAAISLLVGDDDGFLPGPSPLAMGAAGMFAALVIAARRAREDRCLTLPRCRVMSP